METKATISNISIDFESGKQVISLVCEKVYVKKTYEGNMTD